MCSPSRSCRQRSRCRLRAEVAARPLRRSRSRWRRRSRVDAAVGPFDAAVAAPRCRARPSTTRRPSKPRVARDLGRAAVCARSRTARRRRARRRAARRRAGGSSRWRAPRSRRAARARSAPAQLAGDRHRDLDGLALRAARLRPQRAAARAVERRRRSLERHGERARPRPRGLVLRPSAMPRDRPRPRPRPSLAACSASAIDGLRRGAARAKSVSNRNLAVRRGISSVDQLVVAAALGDHDLALGGEVLGDIDQRICASSTSRSRTGPIASMSSRSILAARVDMLEKKNCAHRVGGALERERRACPCRRGASASAPSRIELDQVLEGEHQRLDALGALAVALFQRGR